MFSRDCRFPTPSVAPVLEEKWFGTGSRPDKGIENVAIRPFKLNFNDADLKDLRSRIGLDLKRLQTNHREPLEDAAFTYGFNSHYLTNTIAKYWSEKYDWRAQVERFSCNT